MTLYEKNVIIEDQMIHSLYSIFSHLKRFCSDINFWVPEPKRCVVSCASWRSWNNNPANVRCATRKRNRPDDSNTNNGQRLLCPVFKAAFKTSRRFEATFFNCPGLVSLLSRHWKQKCANMSGSSRISNILAMK